MSGAKKKAARKAAENGVKKEKIYTLSESQITALKESATRDAVGTAFIMMLGLPCMSLRDKFDFGKTRMDRFAEGVLSYYESFNQGYITLEDCVKTIKEETGIDIEVRFRGGRVV